MKKILFAGYLIIILVLSYFTYFHNYWKPSSLFWDENYHIASSQKYLEGVVFMEPHPPLGKLFIAAGEYIFQQNKDVDQNSLHEFTKTDHIKNVPQGYSFLGVRFFPALFAWMSAVIFFLILYLICKNPHIALLFSSLYIFENAIIVHSRAAMLDSSLLFFILLTILYFVFLMQKERQPDWKNYLLLGVLAGFAISVKYNGGIIFLTFPFLWWRNFKFEKSIPEIKRAVLDLATKATFFAIGVLIIFFSVWQIHFVLGKKIEPAGNKYAFSKEYKQIIKQKKQWEISNFPVMLQDNLKYSSHYNKGVPKLDVCKEDENGSYPLAWILGDKTINYRWEKTQDGKAVKYLYLQGNPVIWFLGLTAILLSIILLVSVSVFDLAVKNKKIFFLIEFFALSYIFYMAVMLKIQRVMYLYHYFIPLIFSLILAVLLFYYLFEGALKKHPKIVYSSLTALVLIIILTYIFFSPFTYYLPLTTQQFQLRNWFHFWHLFPVK